MGKLGSILWLIGQRVLTALAAVFLTLLIFLVLPFMQAMSQPPKEMMVRDVGMASFDPPPPPPEMEEPEPEPEPEEPPPQMEPQSQPMDLSQLELALNPGEGGGGFGDFNLDLSGMIGDAAGGGSSDQIFSLDDLDQTPRPLFQRAPTYPQQLQRSRISGTVKVIFTVDEQGNVVNPRIASSTNSGFNQAALEAVKQWKYEPGTRQGKKVRFKVRQPFTFNPS